MIKRTKQQHSKQRSGAEKQIVRLATVVTDSNDAVLLFDPAGNILAWNRGAQNTYGWSEDEALRMNIHDITPPDKIAELDDLVLKLVAGETVASFETQRRTKDGRILDISLTTTAVRDKDKKTTEELKRSNADLLQFAYAASHDLQEPLRGLASFAGLLGKRYKGKLDEKADEFIDYIINDAKRMQELIRDLLEYSQIETKSKILTHTNCSVVLEEALYNLRSAVEETGAELTYDLLPTVMGDASQLKSLFQNLIGNAIKFRSKEKPRIHISAERKGSEWVFSVKDNGIGFDSEFAGRIFVVFQRLHLRSEYTGTGIGLAICKKIVERHGGRIWAESKPGKGSTFYFTLPVQE